MIRGIVSEDGAPTVSISIAGRDWQAIIDTGFNGDFELPWELQRQLKCRFIGRMTSLLAGDQKIFEDVYLVEIEFDGEPAKAEATFVSQPQVLVGTRLMRRHYLEIDFPAATVSLLRR